MHAFSKKKKKSERVNMMKTYQALWTACGVYVVKWESSIIHFRIWDNIYYSLVIGEYCWRICTIGIHEIPRGPQSSTFYCAITPCMIPVYFYGSDPLFFSVLNEIYIRLHSLWLDFLVLLPWPNNWDSHASRTMARACSRERACACAPVCAVVSIFL